LDFESGNFKEIIIEFDSVKKDSLTQICNLRKIKSYVTTIFFVLNNEADAF